MNPSFSNQDNHMKHIRDSTNSLYMTSETAGSTDSLQQPLSSITKTSRHFGKITMAMIDDFFSPDDNSMKLPNNQSAKLKFLPPPTTALMQREPVPVSEELNEYEAIYRRKEENNADYDYAKIKAEYEMMLRKEAKAKELQERKEIHENSSIVGNGYERSESVVESNVTQGRISSIESVTTLNIAPKMKEHFFKAANRLANFNTPENETVDFTDNNNNFNMLTEEALKKSDTKSALDTRKEILEEQLRKYKFRAPECEPKLPITEKKQDIIKFIDSFEFTIIQGTTGCGKTTQVPQYILDSHMEEKKYCNIIVTQPRRIAAITISKRVCEERGWVWGETCGYQIGLDRTKINDETLISYVTTGILLNKLVDPEFEKNFNNKYTHVIMDEIHERDLDTDFCLLITKIKSFQGWKPKVILMSATMDCEIFREYFATKISGKLAKAPVKTIHTNIYPVQEFYWGDLVSQNSFLAATLTSTYMKKMEIKRVKEEDCFYTSSYSNNSSSTRRPNLYQRQYTPNINSQDIRNISSLQDFKRRLQCIEFNMDQPEMSEPQMLMAINLLKYFDEIEIQEVKDAIKYGNYADETTESEADEDDVNYNSTHKALTGKRRPRLIDGLPESRKSVLVFVPGMQEIMNLKELIDKELHESRITVLPLHSEIVIDQQRKVFDRPKPSFRKVILATSIAESSITVPDIKYVIDFGLTKQLICDQVTNYTNLRLEWASKSNMNQRRGRAGRVSEGICYRLMTRQFFQDLSDYSDPCILREPLNKLILNVKRLNQKGEPKFILSMAIQPPKLSDIERTILELKEVGALTLKKVNNIGILENNPHDGDLTYVGRIMANLPIDPRLSKLILLGHTFGKLREAIIIAAGLSIKTFFTCHFKSNIEAFKSKWTWSQGWNCDCLSILFAYRTYEGRKENHFFKDERNIEQWCKSNAIEYLRLKEVEKLILELENRLKVLNIIDNRKEKINTIPLKNLYDIDNEEDFINNNLIIKMMIAGAFYPNYFNAQKVDLDQAYRMIGGRTNLLNTVQLKNLPNKQGILYEKQIQDQLKPCAEIMQIYFEDTKAYVEFKTKSQIVPSNINLAVLLACQMRQLRLPIKIRKYTERIAFEKLKRINDSKLENLNNSYNLTQSIESGRFIQTRTHLARRNQLHNISNDAGWNDLTSKNKRKTINQSEIFSTSTNMTHENGSDSDADTLVDSDDEFRNPTRRTHTYIDPSKCFSYMSLGQSNSDLRSQLNASFSSHLNTSMSSITTPSERTPPVKQHFQNHAVLSSSRQVASMGLNSYLSNPFYVLPAEADQNKPIRIKVQEILTCGNFWCQIDDEFHNNTLNQIHEILNPEPSSLSNKQNRSIQSSNTSIDSSFHVKYNPVRLNLNEIEHDTLCVSSFKDERRQEELLYRARILSVNKNKREAVVIFVDYGNRETKRFDQLFKCSAELMEFPFQAVECILAGIKPSVIKNPNGVWVSAAREIFEKQINTEGTKLEMKIESLDIKNSRVNIQLFVVDEVCLTTKNVGLHLLNTKYAVELDESEKSFGQKALSDYQDEIFHIPCKPSGYITKKPEYASQMSLPQINLKNSRGISNQRKIYGENDDDNDDSMSSTSFGNSSFVANSVVSSSLASDNSSRFEQIDNDDASFIGYEELRGPYSPLECNYYCLINAGHSKRVGFERESINYVAIDDDPLNNASRLMVACAISMNQSGTSIIGRKTCLMPKLPGLSAICCMLFSPFVELRVDSTGAFYTGALCGLGYDELNRMAIYMDNDIECIFDSTIDNTDISMINAVRMAINMVIGSEEEVLSWTQDERNLRNLQQVACQKLLALIERPRELLKEQVHFERANRWNQINPAKLIKTKIYEDQNNDGADQKLLYSYHSVTILNNQFSAEYNAGKH